MAEADLLEEVLVLERQGIAEIEEALAAEGMVEPRTEALPRSASAAGAGRQVVPDELLELAGTMFNTTLEGQVLYQAGLPTAYVQALNHAGTEIDYAEFTAMSGWAFSFGYEYGDISPGFMAIRGRPGGEGPFEVFQIAA